MISNGLLTNFSLLLADLCCFVDMTNKRKTVIVLEIPQVLINGKQVFPTFSNSDLIITSTEIELLLKIPEIQAVVTFKGLLFSIDLPFSLFHNNTEGQCGKLIVDLL